MTNDEVLFSESRERITKTVTHLSEELSRLKAEGVLTELDVEKILSGSQLSAQAIIDAHKPSYYPEPVRRTLVDRLIVQYESSVEDILKEAYGRRYSLERIQNRLYITEKNVLSDFDRYVHQGLTTEKYRGDFAKIIRAEHDKIYKGINSIPKEHPKRQELIESWLKDYSENLQFIMRRYLPSLEDGSEKSIIAEAEGATTEMPIEQEKPLASAKKGIWERLFGE